MWIHDAKAVSVITFSISISVLFLSLPLYGENKPENYYFACISAGNIPHVVQNTGQI